MLFKSVQTDFLVKYLILVICSLFVITSCDESFEPLKENDRYFFSIYGYLDASADTNWLRVIPLRDNIEKLPDVNFTVTLEHLESGDISFMTDSLFTYAGGRTATNFWTTMELFPNQSYRIVAEREDGIQSSVVIEMPEDFPTPIVLEDFNTEFGLDSVLIDGVENLADVRTIWKIDELFSQRTPVFDFPHLQDTTGFFMGKRLVEMETIDDIESISRFYSSDIGEALELINIIHKQVWVASAGPGWLFFPDIDENVVALPDGISNVENGAGYVIGIISKTVPLQSCFEENGDPDEDRDIVACPEEDPLW